MQETEYSLQLAYTQKQSKLKQGNWKIMMSVAKHEMEISTLKYRY